MNNQVEVSRDQVDYILSRCGKKWRGENTYKANSPLRSNSDSGAFSITIKASGSAYTGFYHDFVTDETGSLLKLWELLGGVSTSPSPTKAHRSASKRLETTKPTQSTQSAPNVAKPVYTTLEEYARGHGVDQKHFIKAGWRETNRGGRKALVYPTRGGERFRFLDGEKPKYIHNTGYKLCWYRLEEALALARAKRKPLVICNGEASTIVAQAFGIPATAPTAGEKPKLSEALLQELLDAYPTSESTPQTILIAFDCDKPGRDKAIPLALQLESVDYNARALDLGLNFTGGDLADYLKSFTVEQFYQLPSLPDPIEKQAAEEHVKLLEGIRNTLELDGLNIRPAPTIIGTRESKPLLFSEKVYVVSGDFKLGKSTFCMHIGHCIASGAQAVLGSPDLFVAKAGRVLLLDLEQELNDSVPRAQAMKALHPLLDILDADLWEQKLEEYQDQYDADQLVRALIMAWCTKHEDRALVVVDNLSMVEPSFSGGKDRALQEREWITRYKALAKRFGIAILLVEHNIKANVADSAYTSTSRVRGTHQKQATPNGGSFVLEHTRGAEEQAKGEIRLKITVRGAISRTLYLKRDDTLQHHILSIALEGLSPKDAEKIRSETHKKVIDQLERGVIYAKDIVLYTGLDRSTVYKALSELQALDLVVNPQRGVYTLNIVKLKTGHNQLPAENIPALEQRSIDGIDS